MALLKLNHQQEAALTAYEAALAPPPDPSISVEQLRAMSFPQRFDYVAAHMDSALAKQRAAAKAAKRLYAVLSPDQQKVVDLLGLPWPERGAPLAEEPDDNASRLAPNYRLPGHTNPDWTQLPTAQDLSRVYPSKATKTNVGGKVVMTCLADRYGYLKDCVVDSETPKDMGFGNAALELTGYMRMKPATDFGVPKDAEVTIPLNFSLSDELPKAADTPPSVASNR